MSLSSSLQTTEADMIGCAVHMTLTLIAQRPPETRQTVTVSTDVVARPVTVDALRTGLTAAVTKVTWRADCRRTQGRGAKASNEA